MPVVYLFPWMRLTSSPCVIFGATWNDAVESCCSLTVLFGKVDSCHSRATMTRFMGHFISLHDSKQPGLDCTHGHLLAQHKVKNIS